MKKLFIAVLAVAGLASCMQDEVLSQDQAAIEFGDAFVDNSTKALYETVDGVTTEVQKFQVWGTVTGTGGTVALYDGALVKRPTDLATGYNDSKAWTCDVTRFWTPNCSYEFYAIVDAADDAVTAEDAEGNRTGVPTSILYTADGTTDLLYDSTPMSTQGGIADPGLVKFELQHLLSRIQFTFVNGNPQATGDKGAYSFKVTGLSVGALAFGTCTLPAKTWAGNGSTTIDFAGNYNPDDADNKVSEGKVIIPGKQTLTVSYKYEVYFDNDTDDDVDATLIYETPNAITASLTDFTFAVGTSYNIEAELKLDNQIKFTIKEVTIWTPGADQTIH